MTGDLRRQVKAARDRARRAELAPEIAEELRLRLRCSGCGVWVSGHIPDCKVCSDRSYGRKRDRSGDNERKRQWRARRRELQEENA